MIDFNGTRYYLDRSTGYYRSLMRRVDRDYLHRAVWRFHNGPIPDDYEVHHLVSDKGTIDPNDLHLVAPAEHADLHREDNRRNGKRNHHFLVVEASFTCAACGVEYRARSGRRNRWCSKACANRFWNAHYRGLKAHGT